MKKAQRHGDAVRIDCALTGRRVHTMPNGTAAAVTRVLSVAASVSRVTRPRGEAHTTAWKNDQGLRGTDAPVSFRARLEDLGCRSSAEPGKGR